MINFLKVFLENVWALFENTRVPGFNISIATVLFGSVGAVLSISFLKLIFGLGNSAVSGGSAFVGRGGNNNKIKTSNERKGDKK